MLYQLAWPRWAVFCAVAAIIAMPLPARAQTGPELLVKPWPDKGQLFDGAAEAWLSEAGHIKSTNNAFQLYEFEADGRFRILPGNEISPRIGYDITFLDNHTHGKQVPDQLTDASVALGTGLAKWDKWVAAITFGVGYAGSGPFNESAAWYGKADFVLANLISDDDSVGIIFDYDGHRTFLPDVVLPGVGYSHRFDPKLSTVLGIPFSSVDWKPIDKLELTAEYDLLADFKTSAAYEIGAGWSLFARYDYIRAAFETPGLGKDRRLLFYDRRAEAGVKFSPNQNMNFIVAAGFGWDGSYRRGWDYRRDQLVADFSDEPYLHADFELRF